MSRWSQRREARQSARVARAAAAVEERRSAMVGMEALPSERLVETPAFLCLPGERFVGSHMFLTTRRLLIAAAEPPWGSEARPFVLSIPFDDIKQLAVTDDGQLLIVNLDSKRQEASNLLDLYPSPFSSRLVDELRGLWVERTGCEPLEGPGWVLWARNEFPLGHWATLGVDSSGRAQ